MERAIFLLESQGNGQLGGDRIECMVNPSEVVLRRTAGIAALRSLTGAIQRGDVADDPLLLTGGGRTELFLELLFDATMSGQTSSAVDVRAQTERFWSLTQSNPGAEPEQLPAVRFVWGRAWNFLGVIAALSERLEHFDTSGTPRRSWLRMQLLRIVDRAEPELGSDAEPLATAAVPPSVIDGELDGNELVELHQAVDNGEPLTSDSDSGSGDEAPEPAPSTWLMELAERVLGSASRWQEIATLNDIEDPLRVPPGTVLRVPVRVPSSSARPSP